MPYEAELCHFLVFGAGLAVVGERIDADAAAWHKDSHHFNVFWRHEVDEVFHNRVDTVFVETAVVAEAVQVQFQTVMGHSVVNSGQLKRTQ